MKKIILIIFISTIALFSCKKEKSEKPEVTPTPVSFKFAADVQPIFQQNCGTGGSCHGTSERKDGKVFETHAGASAVPDATIIGSINHSSGFSNMPKSGAKLSATKIAIIEAWVNAGKLND